MDDDAQLLDSFHRRHKWCVTAAPWQPGQLFYMYIVDILV